MFIESNGIRLYYREAGAGHPVVFVHGVGGSSRYWQPHVDVFSSRYRAIAIDLRGCGQSTRAPGPYSAGLYADDLRGLLDALGIDRAAIVGISMGGMVAQEFGLRYPQRTSALVLVDTTSRVGTARDMVENRARLIREQGMAGVVDTLVQEIFTPAFAASGGPGVQLYREIVLANDPTCYLESSAAIVGFDVHDRLPSLAMPTLVVGGEHERMFPVETVQKELVAAIPGARLAVIPNAAHACIFEAPEAFDEVVLAFLDQVLAGD